jgi:hypothetical protein
MTRLKNALDWRFWIWVPVLALLVPFAINEITFLNTNVKIIVSFFLLNGGFSIYAGRFMRQHGAFQYLLLIWPLFFLVSIWLRINSAMYGYYLALLYLVIELFAFTAGQKEEISIEDQIPVDGGFKEQ